MQSLAGWCDVCFKAGSIAGTRSFYEDLGFRRVDGDDSEGWAILTNSQVRLGLFDAKFMGSDEVTLNFRGGDVLGICGRMKERGHEFIAEPNQHPNGVCTARLRDPDGRMIFFESAPGETMPE